MKLRPQTLQKQGVTVELGVKRRREESVKVATGELQMISGRPEASVL